MGNTSVVKHDPQRGTVARQEFTGTQLEISAETALAAVTARERAVVEAHYLMAERHRRNWKDVRAAMLEHCDRPRFAELARYAKPVGKEKINGQWVDAFVRGFTIRFAETLAQAMGNVKPETAIIFENELFRVMRFGVTDLEKNLPRSREVTIAKTVERKGKEKNGKWEPPPGRESLGQRLNTYNEMTYTVRATDDELRNKINSEESKAQRDFILKLCPRDLLEECEEHIAEALDQAARAEEGKSAADKEKALNKLLDRFHEFGLRPSELEMYIGRPTKQWNEADRRTLRELGAAIRDGMTTFDEAMKLRHAPPEEGEETDQERDARIQRQIAEQEERIRVATEENQKRDKSKEPKETPKPEAPEPETRKITQADVDALVNKGKGKPVEEPKELTAEENRALDAEIMQKESAGDRPKGTTLQFGRRTKQ